MEYMAKTGKSISQLISEIYEKVGTFAVERYDLHLNIEAKPPKGNVKMIDSYIFDYSFDGIAHECPYMDASEMFDINDIFKSIDKQ